MLIGTLVFIEKMTQKNEKTIHFGNYSPKFENTLMTWRCICHIYGASWLANMIARGGYCAFVFQFHSI